MRGAPRNPFINNVQVMSAGPASKIMASTSSSATARAVQFKACCSDLTQNRWPVRISGLHFRVCPFGLLLPVQCIAPQGDTDNRRCQCRKFIAALFSSCPLLISLGAFAHAVLFVSFWSTSACARPLQRCRQPGQCNVWNTTPRSILCRCST